jgi:tetratricopeptide (TPR) repeat protein
MRFWVGRTKLFMLGCESLEQADKVGASPSHHDRILAEFLRFAHHLMRGESATAEPFRERLDALAARYGGSWVVDLLSADEFVPYHLAADLVGLKRCMQQLETLVKSHPSVELHLEVVRAMYEGHRGREALALDIYERLADRIAPFADPVWSHAQAHYAECLNALGRPEQALARAESALAHVHAEKYEFPLAYQQLEREAAIALSMLGRHHEAEARLDALLDRFGDADQPLLVGLLHMDRARVAAAAKDRDAFFVHADEARVRFRTTKNPALMARARKLFELGKTHGLDTESQSGPGADISDMELVFPATSSRSDMSVRGQRVLDHVVALVGARRGRLYVLRDGAPTLSAQHGEDRWDESLSSDVDELIRSFVQEDERTAERTGQLLAREGASAASHTLLPLIRIAEGQTVVVGALALAEAVRLRELNFERLERLASAIHDSERSGHAVESAP